MGGAATVMANAFFPSRRALLQNGPANNNAKKPEKKSMQDDARSFYSKASAIKLLIRGEESRKAFKSYLEQTHPEGDVEYLNYYLLVESIKKSGDDKSHLRRQYMDLVQQYETKAQTTKHPIATQIASTMHSWKGIETLPDDELFKLMARSQDDVLAILTPNFEAFVASKFYAEWSKNQNTMEKKKSHASEAMTVASGTGPAAGNRKPLPVFKKKEKEGTGPPAAT